MAGAGRRAGAPARRAAAGSRGRPEARRAAAGSRGRPEARRERRRRGQRPSPRGGQQKKEVNRKPKNREEQEIPFRLREIMRSRQEMKNPLSNKKRKKEAQVVFKNTLEMEAKGTEPDIVVPKFRQRKGESDRAYIQRMEQETQHVLFLSKNQANRQPEEEAAPKKEKSERKKAFQRRRVDKARQKKEAKAVEMLEQELLRDSVKFGEVVLQPPELTAQPRRSVSRDQPGKKSLMLKKILSPGTAQPLTTSLARQRILGEERVRAVEAYRALKKLQRQQQQQQQ